MSALYNMAEAEAEREDCLDWAHKLVEWARNAPTERSYHETVDMAVRNLMVGSHIGRIGI